MFDFYREVNWYLAVCYTLSSISRTMEIPPLSLSLSLPLTFLQRIPHVPHIHKIPRSLRYCSLQNNPIVIHKLKYWKKNYIPLHISAYLHILNKKKPGIYSLLELLNYRFHGWGYRNQNQKRKYQQSTHHYGWLYKEYHLRQRDSTSTGRTWPLWIVTVIQCTYGNSSLHNGQLPDVKKIMYLIYTA